MLDTKNNFKICICNNFFVPVLLVPPEVVEVATKSSEPSEFWGGVGVGSGGGPLMGGKVGGCCISGPAGW